MRHDDRVASTPPASSGIPIAVVAAAVATGVGFLPGINAFDGPVTAGELQSLGWPPLGVVAALMLDRDSRSRLGWVLAALAVLPFAVLVVALLAPLDGPLVTRVEDVWAAVGVVPLLAAVAVISWALGLTSDRLSRRRMTWFLGWAGVVVAVVVVSTQSGGLKAAAVATMLGLWWLASTLALLATAGELRPVDEPLVEAACVGAALVVGGAAGVLMRWSGRQGNLPATEVTGAIVAAIVCALVIPVSWWARNRHLERRYGKGSLAPDDVAAITADLRSQADPRALLSKAAAMVVAASGHRDAAIVLGAEEGEHPEHWVAYPLVVAGERVGTLAVDPLHPEGPEPRQARIVDQMTPTLALVARAVTLAVAAEHSRQNVLHERDHERSRVLGELHDGIGPLLAGLGMRVQARARSDPSDWLSDLAEDLADVRGELRRVVSGLTPSALDDGNLSDALQQLVASFRAGGANVQLSLGLTAVPPRDASVAVYRFVAEGITNAIRHADAKQITALVRDRASAIEAEVIDDGIGGVFTLGVGLNSLRRRAEGLGGTLRIEVADPYGTRLCLALPAVKAA
jgi:signal transduction histidine kinase